MSTNSSCLFIETSPSKWFYVLEDYFAPKNAWDWRDHATCFGPFLSYDAACGHLRSHHANPGGHEVEPYTADRKIDEVIERLIADAGAAP